MKKKEITWKKYALGLSMIEVLIVMAIALPIVMAFMGAFNSMSKSQSRSNDIENLQSSMARIFHDLTQELHAADRVEIVQGKECDELVVFHSDGGNGGQTTTTNYSVIDGKLYKNSVLLSDNKLIVQVFKIKDVAKNGGVPLLHWTIAMGSRRDYQAQLSQEFNISVRQNVVGPSPIPKDSRLTF